MKEILPASRIFDLAVGKQDIVDVRTLYRKMNYCYLYDVDNARLAFNVLTKELIELNEKEFELLNNETVEVTDLSIPLIEKFFLVPLEFNELKLNDQIFSIAKELKRKDSIVSYVILTSTDCNARCFYCYQLGTEKKYMSLSTADDVVKFIINNSKGENVKITWFGGEPLYNIEPIEYICNQLHNCDINFYSNMVSNAYLFDEKLVEHAKKIWKLNKIQITLDGTESIYNARKNYIYKNSESPYRRVLSNIEYLTNSKIHTVIRLNIDMENKDNLYLLVDELYSLFEYNKYLTVYASPIFDYNVNSYKNKHEYLQKMSNTFFDFQEYLDSKFKSSGKQIKNDIKTNSCMADNERSVMILPDGRIGKCDNYVDKYIVGDIINGITNREVLSYLKETLPRKEKCYDCFLLPQCRILKICSHAPIEDCQYYLKKRFTKELEASIEKEYKDFIGKCK